MKILQKTLYKQNEEFMSQNSKDNNYNLKEENKIKEDIISEYIKLKIKCDEIINKIKTRKNKDI